MKKSLCIFIYSFIYTALGHLLAEVKLSDYNHTSHITRLSCNALPQPWFQVSMTKLYSFSHEIFSPEYSHFSMEISPTVVGCM